jgi:hypothetical protein
VCYINRCYVDKLPICLHNCEAASIHIVFFDWRRVLVEEPIQDVGRFTHEAVDDIDPRLVALIGRVIVERDYVEFGKFLT